MGLTRAEAERLGLGHLFPEATRKGGGGGRVAHERILPASYAGWPGRWEIVIPGWTPTRDNKLMHHPLSAHRLKKQDARVVGQAAIILGVPAAFTRRRLTLEVRGRYSVFPDDSAYLKSFWDALTANGLLVDDSREWLEFVWPPTYLRGPKQTRIVLEDIGEPPT